MATVSGHDEGGRGLIDRYLVDLSAQLAFHGVRGRAADRVVAEARDHLLELATETGAEEAITRFGAANAFASEVARARGPVVLFRSALVLLAAIALFILPLYGIPENTLPPAPWDERPAHLTWKLYATAGAFGVAGLAALIAVVAAWRTWSRASLLAMAASGAALGVSAVLGSILAVQWAQAVPGSETTLMLTLFANAVLGCVAVAALASADRVRRISRDLSS